MENEMRLNDVRVEDAFWSPRQKLITEVVIPYQEKVLNDEIPGVEKSHALANFRIAAGLEEGDFYGCVFQDSDVAKWLEGVAYSLINHPDAELESRADAIIDIIGKAQQEDGYLDTYFIIREPDHKWQNLQECHELYCAGHMMEAAVAYYEATGKDRLLQIMQRVVDCIDDNIGEEDGKIHGVPGHEEVEIGLLRMYRATGNEKDLRLARYFINARGTDPDVFVKEAARRGQGSFYGGGMNDRNYAQIYAPVRLQREARGHAVRNVYLLTAMADLALVDQDVSLKEACETVYRNIAGEQLYITGGIGQAAAWEGFTHAYDLPNDTVYAETCASIGLIFFCHRMLMLETKGEYAEVMERALYNTVLSGMQLDGKRFFYVNPLEVNPDVSGKLPGYRHVLPQRPGWYACACCPPNVVRLVESLGRYAWEEREGSAAASAKADDPRQSADCREGTGPSSDVVPSGLILNHLYLGGSAQFTHAVIDTESAFPWEGSVQYTFRRCDGQVFTFAIRIPSYAKDAKVLFNGTELPLKAMRGGGAADGTSEGGTSEGGTSEGGASGTGASGTGTSETGSSGSDASGTGTSETGTSRAWVSYKDGYLYLTRAFADGDVIRLNFSLPVRRIYCSPRVRANEGQVALMRGPLVYCLEGVDNEGDLQALRIPRDAAFETCTVEDPDSCLKGMTVITFLGLRCASEDALYSEERPRLEETTIRAIPYFAWGNRGENQMRVWIHEAGV